MGFTQPRAHVFVRLYEVNSIRVFCDSICLIYTFQIPSQLKMKNVQENTVEILLTISDVIIVLTHLLHGCQMARA